MEENRVSVSLNRYESLVSKETVLDIISQLWEEADNKYKVWELVGAILGKEVE